MKRRRFVAALSAGIVASRPAAAASGEPLDAVVVGAAWRDARSQQAQQFVGALRIDWQRREVAVVHSTPVPSRAHGLLVEPDASLVAVAMRPGTWLMRIDPAGRVAQCVAIEDERRLGGHAHVGGSGDRLYTTETDTATGRGIVGVRERGSLRKVDEWATHGIDPHQLLIDPEGHLLIANGGIARSADDRKRDLDRMDSSLVRLDAHDGRLRGQWRLDDPRLSLRHLAWSRAAGAERPLLGIALQAEHDDPVRRAEAPVLALWDGERLRIPSRSAVGGGYAGDIAATADGGFVLSAQRVDRALLWKPSAPANLSVVAEVREPCALGVSRAAPGGVLVAAAHGVGRWDPASPAAMLRWPSPMALDNHWVVVG